MQEFGYVTFVGLLTALATGLGALPFAFVRDLSPRWQGRMAALAGGMMISVSAFSLADQAIHLGGLWGMVVGMLLGAGFFAVTSRLLAGHEFHIDRLNTDDSRKAMLLILALFVHSIPEGVAVGVGYTTGVYRFGLVLALAIAIHNIPEGIAVSLPLRAKGVSVGKCALFAIFTSLPQPIFAGPAFLLSAAIHSLLPVGLGFAGGAMIYIVIADLLPESYTHCPPGETAWAVLIGLLLMLTITVSLPF